MDPDVPSRWAGRLTGIVQARARKGKGMPPKRHLVQKKARLKKPRPKKVSSSQIPYEPIRNSGLFEKLLYLGRNRSVSY